MTLNASGELRSSQSCSTCPVCNAQTSLVFHVRDFPIYSCAACGHRHTRVESAADHISQVYSDDYFSGGGAGYANYLAEERLLRAHGRRYGELLKRYHTGGGSLLDIGAAAGFILQGMADVGWTGTGIEPNARMATAARDKFGLNVLHGSLEEVPLHDTFDVVSMIQVIAHFVDPTVAFARAASVTRDQGLCLVETWNVQSITAKLFGKSWHEYSPPSVLHWFTPASLEQLAAAHGFEQIARGRPTKWLDGAHAKSLLAHAAGNSVVGKLVATASSLVPDRLPIPYPSEDVFWALFRRRKREA
ncbi:MAG: class I SAM-dependent methyltransferase [Bdellovibrionota bacterium]